MGTTPGRRGEDIGRGQGALMGRGQGRGAQRDQRNTINEALSPAKTARWFQKVTETLPQIKPITGPLAQSEVIGSGSQPMMTSLLLVPPIPHGEVLTIVTTFAGLIVAPPLIDATLTSTLHIEVVPHHHIMLLIALHIDDPHPDEPHPLLTPRYHHPISVTESLLPLFDVAEVQGP